MSNISPYLQNGWLFFGCVFILVSFVISFALSVEGTRWAMHRWRTAYPNSWFARNLIGPILGINIWIALFVLVFLTWYPLFINFLIQDFSPFEGWDSEAGTCFGRHLPLGLPNSYLVPSAGFTPIFSPYCTGDDPTANNPHPNRQSPHPHIPQHLASQQNQSLVPVMHELQDLQRMRADDEYNVSTLSLSSVDFRDDVPRVPAPSASAATLVPDSHSYSSPDSGDHVPSVPVRAASEASEETLVPDSQTFFLS